MKKLILWFLFALAPLSSYAQGYIHGHLFHLNIASKPWNDVLKNNYIIKGGLIAPSAQDLVDANAFREDNQTGNLRMMINSGRVQPVDEDLLISNDVRVIQEFPEIAQVHIQGGDYVFVSTNDLKQVDDPKFQQSNPNAGNDYLNKVMSNYTESLNKMTMDALNALRSR